MTRLQQDIDDLDRMVDTGAAKDAIRSQIRLIDREVAALQSDYASVVENHEKLKAAQTIPSIGASADKFEFRRGLCYEGSDPIPFCPQCWEIERKKIHLSGPVKMFNSTTERWECHNCDKDYSAALNENFLARRRRRTRGH